MLALAFAACAPQMAEMPSRSFRVVVDTDARAAFAEAILDFTRDHGYRLESGALPRRDDNGLVVAFRFYTGELHVSGANLFDASDFNFFLYRSRGAQTPSEAEIDRFQWQLVCTFIHIPGVEVRQREVGVASEGVRIPPEDYEGCANVE